MILDNKLFVATENSSVVEVYDAMNLRFSHQWTHLELVNPKDIVCCQTNKCFYILDCVEWNLKSSFKWNGDKEMVNRRRF